MTDTRKSIRVTIPATDRAKFEQAKKRAEESAMVKLSDTQYASRLIQWAVNAQDIASIVFTKDSNGDIVMSVTGKRGTPEYNEACHTAFLYEEDIEG